MTRLCNAWLATICLTSLPAIAWAQGPDTLEVELKRKTQAHPFFGMGADSCYVIDGVEARELTFVRGRTYVFHINKMDSSWIFYISGSPIGGGRDHKYRGLPTRAYAFSGDYFPYRPIATSPDLVYYQASPYEYAGWKINIVNTLSSGLDFAPSRTAGSLRVRAWTEADGSRLMIHYDLDRPAALRLELFEGLGRRATVQELGEFVAGERIKSIDLEYLPTGLYLYRLTNLLDGTAVTGTLRIAR